MKRVDLALKNESGSGSGKGKGKGKVELNSIQVNSNLNNFHVQRQFQVEPRGNRHSNKQCNTMKGEMFVYSYSLQYLLFFAFESHG